MSQQVHPKPILEIEERDQAGILVATYMSSHTATSKSHRIDVAIPHSTNSYSKTILGVFLPAGYPGSVTKDYLPYQIYDSLQAFSSSIAGLLASRAVLEGVGVGDANASPTAAILLSILQDSMGRIATILFAHRLGTALEPECKMYRLAADVFNDVAMILDCLSPALPKVPRVILLSFSSMLRALCGVCAGSSKASLSAHFATQGNLGELNAKDSSQETIISLLGMLAGSLVVSHISSTIATWLCLLTLLTIHLWMNYMAVRAVSMCTLNRQRANIVFNRYLESSRKDVKENNQGIILSPDETSLLEHIFEYDGVLRCGGRVVAQCELGVPLKRILDILVPANKKTGSYVQSSLNPEDVISVFDKEEYVLWYNGKRHFYIVLKDTADAETQLKAWFHVLLLCKKFNEEDWSIQEGSEYILSCVKSTLEKSGVLWGNMLPLLRDKGWDLENGAMETRSGTRICIG